MTNKIVSDLNKDITYFVKRETLWLKQQSVIAKSCARPH